MAPDLNLSFFQFLGHHYGFSQNFEYFVYIFWSSFDLLNLRVLSIVEKMLLTLEIEGNLKFGNPCRQIPLTLPPSNRRNFQTAQNIDLKFSGFSHLM